MTSHRCLFAVVVWLRRSETFPNEAVRVFENDLQSPPIQVFDTLEITLGADAVTVTVRSLPARRGPATEARQSYEETVDSVARRERHREQRRLAAMAAPQTPGRPDKRTRRELLRFHRNQDGS